MKIVVAGTRGIPDIPGGVETVCEELYPRLAAMGHDVTLIRRSCYVAGQPGRKSFKGVKLLDVYAPRKKSLEAFCHTLLAVLKARQLNPDVLHIHAIGPSLMVPVARLLGLKVVTTNHGPDYDRGKWGRLAKAVLQAGERAGARWSNAVIAISPVIKNLLAEKYGRTDADLIFNGVNRPGPSGHTDYLESLGLEPGRYVIGVGRFVPEKGFHDLVEAFRRADIARRTGCKLVLVGDSDHPDAYSEGLKADARATGAVLTGFIKGERLSQVIANARLFAMPSYHEGLPIALLEAMSYGLDVIASDIPSTRLPELSPDRFFAMANPDALAATLLERLQGGRQSHAYDLRAYDWDVIARQTADVYARVAGR